MFRLSVIPIHSGFSYYKIMILIYNLHTQPKFTFFPLSAYDKRIMKTHINFIIHPLESNSHKSKKKKKKKKKTVISVTNRCIHRHKTEPRTLTSLISKCPEN